MKHRGKACCSLALAVLLLALLPTGCSGKGKSGTAAAAVVPNPQRMEEMYRMPVVSVLMDLPVDEAGIGGDSLTKTLQYLPGYEKDFMVCAESLPDFSHPTERDAAATRIRTEIMAGKGPDLFLCAHPLYGWTAGPDNAPFFHFPEQAMKNRVFLPLNDYIENAEYMDWDQLLPQVMEAGRHGDEQLILPLSFFFSALLCQDYSPSISLPATWEEMLTSEDPVLKDAVRLGLQNIMGQLADFSSDSLLVTEEELLRMKLLEWETGQARLAEASPSQEFPAVGFERNERMGHVELLQEEASGCKMIPPYNTEGGITAYVTTFAAVNSNAKYPELAFKIADFLLSERVQQSGRLSMDRIEGMPVCRELGSQEKPLKQADASKDWYMEDSVFQEYQRLLEEINVVRFPGPLDEAIWGIFGTSEKELEKSVHDAYMRMQMYLAES